MIVTGTGTTGQVVQAELKVVGTSHPSTFTRTYETIVDSDGKWELSLEPNEIETGSPAGSFYTITEDVGGADTETDVTVPRGYGRVALADLPGGPPTINDAAGTDAAVINAIRDRLAELGLVVAGS